MFTFVLDAITDYREEIRLNGDNPEAYLRYGSALYNLNRRNEAAIYFSYGLRINSILFLFDLIDLFFICLQEHINS